MTLTDEQKIYICKFWEENPSLIDVVVNGYDEDDVASLMIEIQGDERELSTSKIGEYRRKIESHLLQKKSQEIQENSYKLQKKQMSYGRAILLATITFLVGFGLDRLLIKILGE